MLWVKYDRWPPHKQITLWMRDKVEVKTTHSDPWSAKIAFWKLVLIFSFWNLGLFSLFLPVKVTCSERADASNSQSLELLLSQHTHTHPPTPTHLWSFRVRRHTQTPNIRHLLSWLQTVLTTWSSSDEFSRLTRYLSSKQTLVVWSQAESDTQVWIHFPLCQRLCIRMYWICSHICFQDD